VTSSESLSNRQRATIPDRDKCKQGNRATPPGTITNFWEAATDNQALAPFLLVLLLSSSIIKGQPYLADLLGESLISHPPNAFNLTTSDTLLARPLFAAAP
jgi:hypothetical protein